MAFLAARPFSEGAVAQAHPTPHRRPPLHRLDADMWLQTTNLSNATAPGHTLLSRMRRCSAEEEDSSEAEAWGLRRWPSLGD